MFNTEPTKTPKPDPEFLDKFNAGLRTLVLILSGIGFLCSLNSLWHFGETRDLFAPVFFLFGLFFWYRWTPVKDSKRGK